MTQYRCTAVAGRDGIANALAKAQPGDEVIVEAGEYRCDSGLSIPSGVSFIGESGAVLVAARCSPLIVLSYVNDVVVAGLQLCSHNEDVPSSQESLSGMNGLFITASNNIVVRDCMFVGFGFGISGSGSGKILRNTCNSGRIGIHISNFLGSVDNNVCQNNSEAGIVVSGSSCSPTVLLTTGLQVVAVDSQGYRFVPSECVLQGNRCTSNGRVGIEIVDSWARLENNLCRGHHEAGIKCVRNQERLFGEENPDVDVRSNFCSENVGDGIQLMSVNGKIEENECNGNHGRGIVVSSHRHTRENGDRYHIVSKALLTGNRCHHNQSHGIAVLSSSVHLHENRCWENQGSGIHVSPNLRVASIQFEVLATCNHCRDNFQDGITFSSSRGSVENNWCQRNKGCGIVVKCDDADTPSEAVVVGNRCYFNDKVGILFLSSHGEVRNNRCRRNQRPGIVIHFDLVGPRSKVDVMTNRCYQNRSGIVFYGTGRVSDNDCHRNGAGIITGIVRFTIDLKDRISPTGWQQVIRNHCRKNQSHGIHVVGAATLSQNSCDANQGAGIYLQGAAALLEYNICTANRLQGIVAIGVPQGVDQTAGSFSSSIDGVNPTYVTRPKHYQRANLTARHNLCSANGRAGITLYSSTALLEENECWANGKSGIVAQLDMAFDGLKIPVGAANIASEVTWSDITARRNICHDNFEYGIVITQSTGCLENNECRGNGAVMNTIERHRKYSPLDWRRIRQQDGNSCIYLKPRLNLSQPEWLMTGAAKPMPSSQKQSDPVVDLIRTGGCPHCFHRFWLGDGDLPALQGNADSASSDSLELDAKDRLYRASRDSKGLFGIRRVSAKEIGLAAGNASGNLGVANSLSSLIDAVSSEWRSRTWSVAFVSANEERLDTQFAASAGHVESDGMRVHSFDYARRDPSLVFAADRSWLIEQMLWGHSKSIEFLKAVALMSALEPLCISFFLLLLVTAAVPVFAWQADFPGSLIPGSVTEAQELWKFGFAKGASTLGALGWISWGAIGLALALALIVFLNRHVPAPLRIGQNWLLEGVKMLDFFPPLERVVQWVVSQPGSGRSRLRWTKTRIFGYRLFGIIGARNDCAVVLLKGVNALAAVEQQELRDIAGLRGEGQSLLMLTHMTGLSMLADTWLDVWFDQTAEDCLTVEDVTLVVHDTESLSVGAEIAEHADPEQAVSTIAHLLGFPLDKKFLCANDLADKSWRYGDLLPALVIGSNYFAPAKLEILAREDFQLKAPRFEECARRYLGTVTTPFSIDSDVLKGLEEHAKAAAAVIAVSVLQDDALSLIGRQSHRVSLARALRIWVNSKEPGRGIKYLSGLLAIGESIHLNLATEHIVAWQTGSDDVLKQQQLPLHVEAALALFRERLQLEESDPKLTWQAWKVIVDGMHVVLTGITAIRAGRIAVACLAAEAAAGIGVAERDSLQAHLVNWLDSCFAVDDEIQGSVWHVFRTDVGDIFSRLSSMGKKQAEVLIEKRFMQDWRDLPEAIKSKMRETLGRYDVAIFLSMSRMDDHERLVGLCRSLMRRPAYLVANLLVLAIPGALAEGVSEADIGKVLRAIRARVGAPGTDVGASSIGMPCEVQPITQQIAWRVFKTMPDWQWQVGADDVQSRVAGLSEEIEGFAVGSHGSVAKVLNEADVVNLALMGR